MFELMSNSTISILSSKPSAVEHVPLPGQLPFIADEYPTQPPLPGPR
jgi:hypothetical protein